MKVIRDPLWNNIRVDPLALQLIDTAAFQRLRYVRQLGVAFLVYPGASHSRFEHALGTYHLARQALLLLDEPTASLDPISTQRVEELVYELREQVTVIIVTHNMQQAARISDRTAFMLMGELIEYGPTNTIFTAPHDTRTEAYITGRFG